MDSCSVYTFVVGFFCPKLCWGDSSFFSACGNSSLSLLYKIDFFFSFLVSEASRQTSILRKALWDTWIPALEYKSFSQKRTVNKMTFWNSLKSIVKKQLFEERNGIVKRVLWDKPEKQPWKEMPRTESEILVQKKRKVGLLQTFWFRLSALFSRLSLFCLCSSAFMTQLFWRQHPC